jgi:hypothetical protein
LSAEKKEEQASKHKKGSADDFITLLPLLSRPPLLLDLKN